MVTPQGRKDSSDDPHVPCRLAVATPCRGSRRVIAGGSMEQGSEAVLVVEIGDPDARVICFRQTSDSSSEALEPTRRSLARIDSDLASLPCTTAAPLYPARQPFGQVPLDQTPLRQHRRSCPASELGPLTVPRFSEPSAVVAGAIAHGEQNLPLPPQWRSWDWPLTRLEKKTRVVMLDYQALMSDREQLQEELMELSASNMASR